MSNAAPDEPGRLDEIPNVNGVPLFYGRRGEPMTLRQWSDAMADFESRTLAVTDVGQYRVKTVWLGTDDDAVVEGRQPRPFGTAVFAGSASKMLDERLSATETSALMMHAQVCGELQARQNMGELE